MKRISTEFYLIILLLLLIFFVNISHIVYLIIRKHNKQIQSVRLILISSSLSSLIVSLWLIPCFYFRTIWPPDSMSWRLWSFAFHIVDAVQLYSILLLITIRSFQRIFICFIWLAPIITYSPLLWLSSLHDEIDYLPYRKLTLNVPWWIFPMVYFGMYAIPLIISFALSSIHICWPLINNYYYRKYKKNIDRNQNIDEHHQDMIELKSLIETVFNFQLEQSDNKTKKFNTCISSISKPLSKKFNRSLSCKADQHETFPLFDEFSSSPLSCSSSIQTKHCIEQPLKSGLLFVVTCLLLLVQLPYILSSLFDVCSLQLTIFIYTHWVGTIITPLIHIK
ncbi:unnamed protein product [Rotaria socialis]|uniref:Uncharacterized protein n=1 Tax=Rotaria socialis TaxID=392032 RepID=A0A821PU79_9BILA|nr:unnamed protein product [Rotaria socialis]CAF3387878.1 unnamed protein product [Rotaria socialis]CAF3449283.1 unnamed protein product [Rotaria socialis]CAF3566011.1 unnamed protein product [Rotaria socialis]CAF3661060.1 unnamed protein product [Rotaria socialis]